MTRSNDLDTIAPDDQIIKENPLFDPQIPKEEIPSITVDKSSESNQKESVSKSKQGKNRQKIYKILENRTKHPLSAFLSRPDVFTFENQSNEEIILVLRQHGIVNFGWVMLTILMTIAPFLLKFTSLLTGIGLNNIIPEKYNLIILIFWFLITFIFAFEKFIAWYFNVFVITEERIIDFDFYNLIDQKMTEASIDQIQDISYKVIGAMPTMFNYGNVIIQTAAHIPFVTFERIPNPALVLEVLQLMKAEETEENNEGRSR